MATKNRLMTSGETDGIQERLKPRHEGPAPRHYAFGKGHLNQATSNQTREHTQGLPRGKGMKGPTMMTNRERDGYTK